MKTYVVYVTPTAWDEIEGLPGHMRQRVRRKIGGLAGQPRPPGSKVLRARASPMEARRIRLDRWRVVYLVDDAGRTVDIVAVRKRPPYDYGDLARLLVRPKR